AAGARRWPAGPATTHRQAGTAHAAQHRQAGTAHAAQQRQRRQRRRPHAGDALNTVVLASRVRRPTTTPTQTPVLPTSTATRTSAPPTATATHTPLPPTSTATPTPR